MLSNVLFILIYIRMVSSAIVSTNIGPVDMEPGFRVRFYESTLPDNPTDAQVKEYLTSQQYVSDGTLLGQLNGITEPTVQYNRYHNDFIHGFYIDPDEIKQFVVEFRGYFKWDENGNLNIRWRSPFAKACGKNLFRTTGAWVKIYPDTYLDTSASDTICLNDNLMEDNNDRVFSGNMTISSGASLNLSRYVTGMWYPIIISVFNAGDGLDGEFMYRVDGIIEYLSLTSENSGYNPNDNYPYFDANRKTNPVAKRCPVFDADNYVEPQVPPPYVTTAYTCPSTETSSTVVVPTPSSSSESIVESSSSALPVESSSSEWSGESTLSESVVGPTASESSVEQTSSEPIIEPTPSESIIKPTPSESIVESAASTTSEYASSLLSSVVTSTESTEDQTSTNIETDSVSTPQPSSTGPSDMSSVDSYSSTEINTVETATVSNTENPETTPSSSISSEFYSSSIEDIITSHEWTSLTSDITGSSETSTHSPSITDQEAEESSTMHGTATNTLDVPNDLSTSGTQSSSDITTIDIKSTPTHPTATGDKPADTQTVGSEMGTRDGKSWSTDKLVTVTEDSNGGVVTTTTEIRPGEGPDVVTTHVLSDTMNGADTSGAAMDDAGDKQKPSGDNAHASTDINNDDNPYYMGTGGSADHPTTTLGGTDDHASSPTKGTSIYDHANNAVDDAQPYETSFAGLSDRADSTGTSVSLASYKTVTTATNTHPIQLEEFVGQASSYTVWSSLLVLVASFALL